MCQKSGMMIMTNVERGEIMFPLKVDDALIQGQLNIRESQHQEGKCI